MKIKKFLIGIFLSIFCIGSSYICVATWVPDAWDVYPQEFFKIFDISSKYTSSGMNLENLTIKNFKGHSYIPKPIVDGMDLAFLTRQFKTDYNNNDVVGWIYVPKTNINYPIVQHPSDTNFYNDRNYEKIKNTKQDYGFPGVIWIDSNCNFVDFSTLSENSVLYGHNWENYTSNPKKDDFRDIMFSQFNSFHHIDYAKSRPYIYIANDYETIILKIFAVFYTEDEFQYHITSLTQGEKLYIIQEALARSRFIYDSPVYLSDKIFTFSTCTRAYGKGRHDQKFVIMARPLRKNESIDDVLDENYITFHKNHKEPSLKKINSK